MHVRRRVPFLKIVPIDAVLAKLGIAKPQLIFAQVTHLLTPIAVRRSAANDDCFHNTLFSALDAPIYLGLIPAVSEMGGLV